MAYLLRQQGAPQNINRMFMPDYIPAWGLYLIVCHKHMVSEIAPNSNGDQRPSTSR
jgi:hypothetical protein